MQAEGEKISTSEARMTVWDTWKENYLAQWICTLQDSIYTLQLVLNEEKQDDFFLVSWYYLPVFWSLWRRGISSVHSKLPLPSVESRYTFRTHKAIIIQLISWAYFTIRKAQVWSGCFFFVPSFFPASSIMKVNESLGFRLMVDKEALWIFYSDFSFFTTFYRFMIKWITISCCRTCVYVCVIASLQKYKTEVYVNIYHNDFFFITEPLNYMILTRRNCMNYSRLSHHCPSVRQLL